MTKLRGYILSNNIAIIRCITVHVCGYLAKFLLEKGYRVIGLYRRAATDTLVKIKEHGIVD